MWPSDFGPSRWRRDRGAKNLLKLEKMTENAGSRRRQPAETERYAYFIAIFLIMAITSLRSLSFKLAE